MESVINFLIKYNAQIIYFSAASIALLSAVVVWWQVFGKKVLKTDGADDFDLNDIEESLQKILKQTHLNIQTVSDQQAAHLAAAGGAGVASAVAAASASGALPPDMINQIKTIDGKPIADLAGVKKELETRASIIEDLQKKVSEAKSADNSSELLAKIKNLESKLLEYEIIEDDIADLSLFKEENAKLKAELDELKRGGAKLVDQFAEEIAKEEGAGKETEDQTEPVEDRIIVQKSVGDEMSDLAPEVRDSSASQPDSATTKVVSEPVSEAETKGDIFGEFSEGENSDDPLAALGDIDPDKMLNELKDLNADAGVGLDDIAGDADIEKMAQEATSLGKKE